MGSRGSERLGFASYTGQVASPTRLPINRVAVGTLAQSLCRTRHIAMAPISSIQLGYAGFFLNGGTETGVGATVTHSASVEYPVGTLAEPGTRTRITFGGSNDGAVISSFRLFSDSVVIPGGIPEGAEFFVWTFARAASGFIPRQDGSGVHIADPDNGGAYTAALSGLTDVCTSGTFTHTDDDHALGPCVILGTTTKPSVLLLGDSRGYGADDTWDGTPHIGEVARSLGKAGIAYASFSAPSHAMSKYTTDHSREDDFWPYFTHQIIQLGTNDINAGASLATMQTRANAIKNYAGAPARTGIITVAPRSTSTDAWATVGNQTTAGNDAVRVTYNDWIRGAAAFWRKFEFSDVVESSRNSGLWKAPGYTLDGVHQTQAAFVAQRDANIFGNETFYKA